MHPALSVIFFTTLSGAGYGLLAWLGAAPRCCGGLPRRGALLVCARCWRWCWSTVGLLSSLAAPRQAAARVARVLAVAHVVAVARGRAGGADVRAGAGAGGCAAAGDARGAATAPRRAARVGLAGCVLLIAGAGHGGLHGDDLRLAQADPGLAASRWWCRSTCCSRC